MSNTIIEIFVNPTRSPIMNYFIFDENTSGSSKRFIKGAFKLIPVSGDEANWVMKQSDRFEVLDDFKHLECRDSPFNHERSEGSFLLGKNILAHIDFSKA